MALADDIRVLRDRSLALSHRIIEVVRSKWQEGATISTHAAIGSKKARA
jgi:hypothetical protein